MTLNEVSPPGWGHTKSEKEKTKHKGLAEVKESVLDLVRKYGKKKEEGYQ